MKRPNIEDHSTPGCMLAPHGSYDYEAYANVLVHYADYLEQNQIKDAVGTLNKQEVIERHARHLKSEVGMGLSSSECYQLIKNVVNEVLPDVEDTSKHIDLPIYGIKIVVNNGGGSITSNLHEEPAPNADKKEIKAVKCYNAAMDGIESIILAHAIAGIDVASDAYQDGITTSIDGCANNI